MENPEVKATVLRLKHNIVSNPAWENEGSKYNVHKQSFPLHPTNFKFGLWRGYCDRQDVPHIFRLLLKQEHIYTCWFISLYLLNLID